MHRRQVVRAIHARRRQPSAACTKGERRPRQTRRTVGSTATRAHRGPAARRQTWTLESQSPVPKCHITILEAPESTRRRRALRSPAFCWCCIGGAQQQSHASGPTKTERWRLQRDHVSTRARGQSPSMLADDSLLANVLRSAHSQHQCLPACSTQRAPLGLTV